jgi:hypothetical protein
MRDTKSRSSTEYEPSMGGYLPRRIFNTSAHMLPPSNACRSVVSSYRTHPSASTTPQRNNNSTSDNERLDKDSIPSEEHIHVLRSH